MSRRRWAVLATGVLALDLFLWLAPPGLALRASLVNALFGPRMVRAEVIVLDQNNTPQDYRLDRGTITGATSTSLTLAEADGTTQTIPIGPSTRFLGVGKRFNILNLTKGPPLRVLVIHLANAPAETVQAEGRGP